MTHHLNDTEIGSQSIFVNSDDAELSLNDAEKVFFLNQNIVAPAGYRLVIGLTNMTLPNAMYNINSTNNTIQIDSTPKTIPVGNYSATGLVTAINTEISDGTGGANLGTVKFETDTNSFKITYLGGVTRTLLENDLTTKVMGFVSTSSPNPFSAQSGPITAENVCDMGGTTNIYVRLRNLSFNNLDSRGNVTNVVANVVNSTNFGGYIFYQPPEVLYYLINETVISHLDIELTDQQGNLLELNGAKYNLTFTVHYTKQRESITKRNLLEQIRESKGETKNETKEQKKST